MTIRTARRATVVPALALAILLLGTSTASAGPVFPPTLGTWSYQSSITVNTGADGEGYASIATTGGWVWGGLTATKVYNKAGWQVAKLYPPAPYTHIGDPDAAGYFVYVPLQRNDGVRTMGFQVYNLLSGATFVAEWTVPGLYVTNNSWIAISPDNKWMLNGGWGNESYFTAFARPTAGGPITLAFRIDLDQTLRNIQGCDFVTNMKLVCQDDKEGAGNKSVWSIDLNHYLDGVNRTARATRLGPAPGDQTDPTCVEGESEGVDWSTATSTLRTTFIDGCSHNKTGTLASDYK